MPTAIYFIVIGLILDLFGVVLLFKFGILPKNLWNHILMDSGMREEDERRHKIGSNIGLTCLILGFALQIIGTLIQYNV